MRRALPNAASTPMTSWLQPLLLGAGFGAAFLLGRAFGDGPATVAAQDGRGPVNPAPAPVPLPTNPEAAPPPPVVYNEDNGAAAVSSNGFLAVTGSYGVGTSVLYLVDTVNRQLAVYEARGGGMDQRRIVLVGARRIDLDLQLRSYNDRSEYEYDRLERLFQRGGKTADPDVKTGLEPANGRK